MGNTANLNEILKQIQSGHWNHADIEALSQLLKAGDRDTLRQIGKYNVSISEGKEIQIGDRQYFNWDKEALQALIQAIRKSGGQESWQEYYDLQDVCCDREVLKNYLSKTIQRLRKQGCLEFKKNVIQDGRTFNCVARQTNFEICFGLFTMRGEAFFCFSELASIQMISLQEYARQCFTYARTQASSTTVNDAIFNARVPTNICFAIAIVDRVDSEVKNLIQTTNPFDSAVDLLWYQVPIVYDLSHQKLYYYHQPTSFFEQFQGEMIWKQLRSTIQASLM